MRRKKVFLADDSITIQKVVELTFSEGNYEVICVGNGSLAMQRVAEIRPDVALLDVVMPEHSGYEVCAAIKKNPDLQWMPVLLLTGAFEAYDPGRAKEAGADGHMTKPFESRGLIARVEQLLAAHPRPGAQEEPDEEVAQAPARPSSPAAAKPPSIPAAAQTVRMKAAELFTTVPPGPARVPPAKAPDRAGQAPPSPPSPPASLRTAPSAPQPTPGAYRPAAPSMEARSAPAPLAPASNPPAPAIPPETLQRAVREAVADIADKVVREVAWEVIPDLAEAIIRRRIRELEDEAVGKS